MASDGAQMEEAETWLARVDQSPPESMHKALRPTMSALIKKELLDHSVPDIKLAVASCLTEVTRITAPEAPYDDDVMKDVFTRVVEAFEKLDDMESPSYARRVAMLETVAKVRSCVLMLDLDCDDLIRDMFHHFFRTISNTHQENVITSMETVMKFVIDESEDVQQDMPSCLLQDLASYLLKNLKKEEKETLPASFELAEKVINKCYEKLKPVFTPLLRGTPLDEYSEVVTSLFEDALDAGVADNSDAPGKDMVADGKLSHKIVSDESAQESSKLEQDANCPGKDGTPPNNTSTSAVSNGCALIDRVKSPSGPSSSDKKAELPSDDNQAKDTDDLISGAKEIPEPITTEPEKPSDHNLKKSHKLDTSTDSEVVDHSKAVNNNEDILVSRELSPETDDGDNKLPPETGNRAADDKSKHVDNTPAGKGKRGRPPASKSHEKKNVGKGKVSGLESKKADAVSDSGGRATRRLAKDDDIKSSFKKTGEGESSKKKQKENLKQQEDTPPDEDTDEDLSLKDIVSPKSSAKTGKNKGQAGDSGGSKRKRAQEAEETPQPKKNKILKGNLVGSRIKVWWPDDRKFYKGVVESFDVASKKHKVVYDDGDVERLHLKNEKWEFIDEGRDNNPDASSDIGKHRGTDVADPPKKRGRPKGVRSSNSSQNDDSPLKGKSAENDDEDISKTPKSGSALKNEGGRSSRSTGKTKDGLLKGSNKDETGNTKSASKSKNDGGSKHKDSKDEAKSSGSNPKGASTPKAADGSKTNGLSTKRKQKEKEGESSEEEEHVSAKISTGKKRRRKAHN
ncbi:hypothetical protein OsJ_15354 [Oryza sativa Japonica Group]|uniref:Uncharacterized protein n=1 Tax=Oryza sativa subsp. japonica TaxID=39947 RepID=B9FFZ1_ORYSJ|nr:hypothetical protein OsJ_15354 [Oryza sativa Japonica Group]